VRERVALVIEPETGCREELSRRLALEGFRVIASADVEAAIASVQSTTLDLVVIDVTLDPTMLEALCRSVRTGTDAGGPPILAVTDANDVEQALAIRELGVTDFIRRPIAWDFLTLRVRHLMRTAKAFAEAHEVRAGLAIAQRIAQVGSWEWDLDRDEIRWSEQLFRIFGFEPNSVCPSLDLFLERVPEGDRQRIHDSLVDLLHGKPSVTLEQGIRQGDGTERIFLCYAETALTAQGRARRVHGTVQDITERRRTEERIRQLAYFDGLTGLPNRTWFMERLDAAIATARRHRRLFAVMFLDLDKFKRINDTLGHHAGDELLSAFAKRVSQCIRKEDTIARIGPGTEVVLSRLGGDEFCVLLTDLARSEDAGTVAERILAALAEPFVIAGYETFTSSSIGIAVYPHDGGNADELLKAADVAMYHSKERGRETFHFYDPVMNARAAERLVLESELRRAIEREEFVVHYQPVVDARDETLVGLEALVRWRHPTRGLLLPGQFVDVAEESRMLTSIGDQVLRMACTQLSRWRAEGRTLVPVSVNLSAHHFRKGDLPATIGAMLAATGIGPHHLRIEITEGVLMADLDATLPVLRRLQAMGIRLALDDFGTGYSSLGHLQRLPFDDLKIDRSFTRDIGTDADHAAITTAIIDLAHRLRRSVIAEGIEDASQVGFLLAHRCHLMQGHLFGSPEPADLVAGRLSMATSDGHPIVLAPATTA